MQALSIFFSPSGLKGKNIVVVSNLKPAKLRGELSQGMLLAAEKDNKVRLLEAPNSRSGDQVFIEGITPKTKQISIEKFKEIKLTTKNRKVLYKDKPLKTEKEDIFVDISDGAEIR